MMKKEEEHASCSTDVKATSSTPPHNGSTNVTDTSVSHNSRTSSADGVTVEKMLPTEAREAAASPPLDQTVVQQQQQQQQQQQTTSVETAGTNKSVQDQALAEGNVDEISSRVDVIHSGDKDEQEDKETDELHGGEAAQRREQQSLRSSLSSNAQPRVLVVDGGGDGSDSSSMDDPSRRHTGLLLAVSNRTSNLECSNSSSGGENLNEGDDDALATFMRPPKRAKSEVPMVTKANSKPLIDNENVMELEECEFYFYLVLFLFVLQFTLHRDQSKVVLRLVSLTKNVSLKFLHFLLIPKFSAGFFGDSA